MAVLRPAAVLAFLLLAGCAGAAPDPLPAAPTATLLDVPIAFDAPLNAPEYCTPPNNFACDAGATAAAAPRLLLLANQTPLHLAIRLEADGSLRDGEEAVLEVDCDPAGPACGELAAARGQPPLSLDEAIAAPQGAILRFFVYVAGRATPDEPYLETPATLTGVVQVSQAPPAPTTLVHELAPVDFAGATFPCGPDYATLCGYPMGTDFEVGPFDGIDILDLNLTWTAASPLTQSLKLFVSCDPSDFERFSCEGVDDLLAVGPSPLRLQANVSWPPSSSVRLEVRPMELTPDPYEVSYPLPQEYQLTGTVGHWKEPLVQRRA